MRIKAIVIFAAICLSGFSNCVGFWGFGGADNTNNQQPNIICIMGDDIGWMNWSCYHRGVMNSKTPNIDKLAQEGGMFTDYYAEPSCTAGRANFITGQLPLRTGLTTVGQAGANVGMPDTSPTIATILQELGYATGQFGKNHFGDRNKFLPTVHGFDEYFGWLYHLDAMEDPFNRNYPKELLERVGPRNLIHSFATNTDDPTEHKRWGRIGKQRIEDKGPLPPHPMEGIEHNMEDIDDHLIALTGDFMERATKQGKPFFVWLNPSRMHVYTHLSEKYLSMINAENNWTISEAGIAQFDDIVGSVMDNLKELGVQDNTIIIVTTDNGAENFTWPDGQTTPFAGGKGMVLEGGMRSPCVAFWPNHIKKGSIFNGIFSGLDWLPTLTAAAG